MAAALGMAMLPGCASVTPLPKGANLQRQVADTERAFAKTMADRDHAAFVSFLSDETIFFSGAKALRGKQQVADAWKRFYDGPAAPFSWQPEVVEVLDSGTLALSSGPVRNPQGELVATFTSIWRLEAPETWRIIFDKGNDVCDCAKP
jgi:ketosteroid isomerase-like protein